MANIATQLKKFRIEAKMTQKELASRLNVSQNAIFNWENGKREPSLETIEKLADIFDTLPSQIMGWDEKYERGECEFDEILDKIVHELPEQAERSKMVRHLEKLISSQNELENRISKLREDYYQKKFGESKRDKINILFHLLNEKGQDKAVEQVELLTKIPEYQREEEEQKS